MFFVVLFGLLSGAKLLAPYRQDIIQITGRTIIFTGRGMLPACCRSKYPGQVGIPPARLFREPAVRADRVSLPASAVNAYRLRPPRCRARQRCRPEEMNRYRAIRRNECLFPDVFRTNRPYFGSYSSSVTAPYHCAAPFDGCVPIAIWVNSLSGAAPFQCTTSEAIFTTSPGRSICTGFPCSW